MSSAAWIKCRVNLFADPAVFTIADSLDIKEAYVVGLLMQVWAWADQYVDESGLAEGMTPGRIDRIADQKGLADAMVDAGWLEYREDGIVFPNYTEHNGSTAKTRAMEQKKKARQRASKTAHKQSKNIKTEPEKHTPSASNDDFEHTSPTSAEAVPNVTGQEPDQRRKEEIREDNTPLNPPEGKARVRESKKRKRGKQTPAEPAYSSSFEAFWNMYPKKEAKTKAAKAWEQHYRQMPNWVRLVQVLDTYKKSDAWKRDHGRYVPQLANWIIDRRWDDVPPESSAASREESRKRGIARQVAAREAERREAAELARDPKNQKAIRQALDQMGHVFTKHKTPQAEGV